MIIWEIIKSIVLGIVQGITEWLPISSTGHMLLINEFMQLTVSADAVRNTEFFNMFKVVVQLGSILAVLVLYFHKLNPWSSKKSLSERKSTWSLWCKVLVASLPAAVVGLLFDDVIEGALSTPVVIAAALIIYGFLFLWLENRNKQPKIQSFSELNYKTALFIGAFQMLALIPGTSRSGSTILGAVFLGASRTVAAEFSFFMAIPVMAGASGLKLVKFAWESIQGEGILFTGAEWAVLLVGTVVSFVVSLLVIKFLMNFIKKHDFKVFGYYRIVLGALVLLYFLGIRNWIG